MLRPEDLYRTIRRTDRAGLTLFGEKFSKFSDSLSETHRGSLSSNVVTIFSIKGTAGAQMTTTSQPDDYNESAIRRVQQQLAQEPTGQYVDPGQAAPKSTGPEQPGTILAGRYKLIENIGEGGMGSVWVAQQQQPIKRRVAIKLVKAGMDSRQVLARFDAERQALALMDHPNIARVFDGGMADTGRPFFVMEYVKGIPFTEYCDKSRLSLNERLQLFIPVCHAVQHAHQKGIVHRDLKPSNILICLYDGQPVPKVIDFGLAKALHQPLTEHSIHTGHGMLVGTPLYMSPEQAEQNNLDVDTRTDIYSLGVILYELLAGTTPLEWKDLRKAAHDEMMRLIKEVEPPRPSVRLSDSTSLPSIAAQRSIDPRELRRSLAGELDWIVMKSLEKERSRRYETANGLSRDIERFLNDEPVEACPPSRAYQLKKFVRKHKGKVLATATVLATLLFGLVGTTWQSYRATKAERAAIESERATVASEQKTLEALAQVTLERDAKEAQRKLAEAASLAEAKQRELAERQLIDGLLRPIGYGEASNEAELRSIIDIAAIQDSRLKLRILEVGLENPEIAMRLARRSAQVIQSTVCLSPSRRAKAIELMSAKQRDMTSDPLIRVAATWLALELASTDTPALDEALTWFIDPPSRSTASHSELYYAFHRLWANSSNSLCAEQATIGWVALIGMLQKSTNERTVQEAVKIFGLLTSKLSTEQVERSAEVLISRLEEKRKTSSYVRRELLNGIAALAPKLSPEQVTHCWDALIGLIEESPQEYGFATLKSAGPALAALAPKLSPEQVTRGWDVLLGLIEGLSEYWSFDKVESVGPALAALAPRLSSEQVTRGWEPIIGFLKNSHQGGQVTLTVEIISALSPKLSTKQVTSALDALVIIAERKGGDHDDLKVLGKGFATLAPKLSDERAMRDWESLINLAEFNFRNTHGEYLAALVPKLSAAQVTSYSDALVSRFEGSTDFDFKVHYTVARGLAALAPRLSTEQVMPVGDALISILETTKHNETLTEVGTGLVVLASMLSSEQVNRASDALTLLLEKSKDEDDAKVPAKVLAALALEQSPDRQVRAAELLVDCMQRMKGNVTIGGPLLQLIPKLDSPTQNRITSDCLTFSLDLLVFTSLPIFDQVFQENTQNVAMAIANQRRLALLLQHPAVGRSHTIRESMLQRFEELVLYDGQRVYLQAPTIEGFNIWGYYEFQLPPTAFGDESAASTAEPTNETPVKPKRQFHNAHDVAEWIEKNWPDFDLDATHPVTFYPAVR